MHRVALVHPGLKSGFQLHLYHTLHCRARFADADLSYALEMAWPAVGHSCEGVFHQR